MKGRFAILLLLSALAGCGAPQEPAELSYAERAEVAFQEAEEALDDGNTVYALSLYRRVRDTFELSTYAVLSELRIGDVYFEQGEHPLAAQAYRQFIQLHPAHPAVPYARFRIGMAYYEEMPSDFFILPPPYERELGATVSARHALADFLERHRDTTDPQTREYVAIAEEAFQEAVDRLAGYELYVAEFYLERSRPLASADHLRTLLDDFPTSSLRPQALFLLARSFVELSDVFSALETIATLESEFPEHELSEQAREWMTRHDLSYADVPSSSD